jgi:excisionase family DNA binding protein
MSLVTCFYLNVPIPSLLICDLSDNHDINHKARLNMSTVDILRASELLCVHVNTVAKLIHSGDIPAAKIGRAYVMLECDVIGYATSQIVKQTAARMGIGRTTRV